LSLLVINGVASAELVLVQDGQPAASIVVGAEASPQAREAAAALQQYLERISGASLPILGEQDRVDGARILVGHSGAVRELGIDIPSGHTPRMDEEGFVIKTVGPNLVLAGNEDWAYMGTLFAVYDFLENELGCRWYMPGPFGEVIPEQATVAVKDLDRVERPSFRIRDIWYSGWMPVTFQDKEWMRDWYIKNKLTKLGLSLPGDGTVSRLAPADEYFESHPHIYALDHGGERMPDMLCMSEPDAVRIGAVTIKATFREDADMLTFGFAPPDGYPMCYCERCQEHFPGFYGKGYGDPSLSEVWFQFANKIAADVRRTFPERWVLTNGYANRVRPPESVKPLSPNLGIQSAMLAACTFHPIGDARCWQRQAYKQVLDRWMDALDFVIVYDYDPGKSLDNLPFPNLHNLKKDFPYFKEIGLWGFWTEGQNAWMVNHLSYYVRAKLMWDAEANVDKLVNEYCRRFYGPAGPVVERYLWELEKAVDRSTIHETWGRHMPWRPVLNPVLPKLDQFIARAEADARELPERERVRMLRLVHDHMKAGLAMEEAAADAQFRTAVEWADRMFALREEAEQIQTGLLPRTTQLAADHSSSVERQRAIFEKLAAQAGGMTGELIAVLPRQWEFKRDPEELGILEQWYLPGTGSGWKPIDTTLHWEAQGYQDRKGWSEPHMGWYRTSVEVPAEARGKTLRLTFGGVHNQGVWLWINGVMRYFDAGRKGRLGFYDNLSPIEADVTDLVRPGQTNHIAVLVDTEAPGRNPRSGIHRRAFLWSPRGNPQ
jgi:hypothetical protein